MTDKMERLRFMLGEWIVNAHIMSADGEWIETSIPKETTIQAVMGGVCHSEYMPVSYDGYIVRLFFSWSYDKYKKVYSMISCDDATGLMGVLEGNFNKGADTIVINDLHTNTAILEEKGQPVYFRQLASTKTSVDSFTDIISESYDGGKNWQPVFRAIHTRK
jgi:hypothetical protein